MERRPSAIGRCRSNGQQDLHRAFRAALTKQTATSPQLSRAADVLLDILPAFGYARRST